MRRLSRIPLKRRRQQKTDYYARKRLLLSGLPRLVVRNSAQNTWIQIVEAQPGGDRVLASAYTRRLAGEFGWKGGLGNTPAAYLTGLLAGLEARSKGVEKVVLDAGLGRLVRGSRVSAALKGAIDGGLHVPYSKEVLPPEERIEGEHISRYAEALRTMGPELYKQRFSAYFSRGTEPVNLAEHFKEVRGRIVGRAKKV